MDEMTNGYDAGALDALAAALAAAQAEFRPVEESGWNPHLKSRYSTLTDIWAACREPLTRNGLCIVQCPMPDEEGWVSLQTMLIHSSGQRLSSITRIPVGKHDAQAFGSALSYARRYSLPPMIGLSTRDGDDDGERTVDRQERQESAGDRAATAPGAVIHAGPDPCPDCRAPAGKRHAAKCRVLAGAE